MSDQVPQNLELSDDLSVEIRIFSKKCGELQDFNAYPYLARPLLKQDVEQHVARKVKTKRKKSLNAKGTIISVCAVVEGSPEVCYYLLDEDADGNLLGISLKKAKATRVWFFATTTIEPINTLTILNWDVKAKIYPNLVCKKILISIPEQRSQEKRLQLNL